MPPNIIIYEVNIAHSLKSSLRIRIESQLIPASLSATIGPGVWVCLMRVMGDDGILRGKAV